MEEFLDTARAAQELGVTPNRVRQLIQKGQLPAKQFSGRYVIVKADLEAYRDLPPGRPHHPRRSESPTEMPEDLSEQ